MQTTTAQTALLAKLPEAFKVREAFSKSNAPGTEILALDGRVLFRLTTGEPAAWKSVRRAGRVVMVERLSSADAGGDNLSVWMKE